MTEKELLRIYSAAYDHLDRQCHDQQDRCLPMRSETRQCDAQKDPDRAGTS